MEVRLANEYRRKGIGTSTSQDIIITIIEKRPNQAEKGKDARKEDQERFQGEGSKKDKEDILASSEDNRGQVAGSEESLGQGGALEKGSQVDTEDGQTGQGQYKDEGAEAMQEEEKIFPDTDKGTKETMKT
ncbi:uncharacterized protein M6B38_337995 [Iris pallida]|uniref:Uncharacterized protein n=1 Tax=Iris pallida TaxID=29817 RepID=A0AAX6GXP8_IRIPA|nr:Uncharacterized protein M6B38_221630 [Iris pallida]KAJ6833560.1 uncharacterized protein M6B38_337995 [Iris pallida]